MLRVPDAVKPVIRIPDHGLANENMWEEGNIQIHHGDNQNPSNLLTEKDASCQATL
jgi:hypothetical protein